MGRKIVTYKGWSVFSDVKWEDDKKNIAVTMYPGGNRKGLDYKPYDRVWKNYCPLCKKEGYIKGGGKGGAGKTAVEGELTCHAPHCGADYDGVTGADKLAKPRGTLTPGSTSSEASTSKDLGDIKAKQDKAKKDSKAEFKKNKLPKKSMTLKTPPLKGIKDGYCHELKPPLVPKRLIVYVDSVDITEDDNVLVLKDKLEAPGEEYKPPNKSNTASTGGDTAVNFNAGSAIEKEIMTQGNQLKASTDVQTVKNIENWLMVRTGKGGFKYTFYYNWWPKDSGDPYKLDTKAIAKRWNNRPGGQNCVTFAWMFYILCQGAGVTVSIINGDAYFKSAGRDYGHLWNTYKGRVIDCSSHGSTNFRPKKTVK